MPFVPVAGALKIEWFWLFDFAKSIVNVTHGDAAGEPFTVAQMNAVATAAHAGLTVGGTHLTGRLANSIQLVGVRVTDLSSSTGHQSDVTFSPVAGEVGDVALPPSDAAVISLKTTLRSRSGRGRVYVAGIPAGHLATGGVLTAGAIDGLKNAWDTYAAALAAATPSVAPGVYSRTHALIGVVTGREISPNVRSQRRRELDH